MQHLRCQKNSTRIVRVVFSILIRFFSCLDSWSSTRWMNVLWSHFLRTFQKIILIKIKETIGKGLCYTKQQWWEILVSSMGFSQTKSKLMYSTRTSVHRFVLRFDRKTIKQRRCWSKKELTSTRVVVSLEAHCIWQSWDWKCQLLRLSSTKKPISTNKIQTATHHFTSSWVSSQKMLTDAPTFWICWFTMGPRSTKWTLTTGLRFILLWEKDKKLRWKPS